MDHSERPAPPAPEPRACAVCARVLAAITLDGAEVRYDHELIDQPADHPPVPVPPDAIHTRQRCDFCTAEDPGWVLPARTFSVPGLPAASVQAWAACEPCAALIRLNQWTRLRARCVPILAATNPAMRPAEVDAALGRLWRQLRRNLIAGHPIRKAHPTEPDPDAT